MKGQLGIIKPYEGKQLHKLKLSVEHQRRESNEEFFSRFHVADEVINVNGTALINQQPQITESGGLGCQQELKQGSLLIRTEDVLDMAHIEDLPDDSGGHILEIELPDEESILLVVRKTEEDDVSL